MARCINCFIAIPFNQKYQYHALDMGPEMITVIEDWISRQVVETEMLCQECISLLLIETMNRISGNIGQRQLGHASVCVSCGISIDRRTGRRSHSVNNDDAEWVYIANVISPLQMPSNARACYACWIRARTHQQVQSSSTVEDVEMGNGSDAEPQVDPNPEPNGFSSDIEPSSPSSIESEEEGPPVQNPMFTLEGYRRTSENTKHCFVPDCVSTNRKRVPLSLRKRILTKQKLYISMNARVCENHLSKTNWDFLDEFEFTSDFTRKHVVQMLDLLRT